MNNINLDAILSFNGISDSALKIILDAVYPVGIVTEFVNSVNPNDCMRGQVWKKLPGGYHPLTTDNNNPSNETDWQNPNNHKPGTWAHGGLPNITGTLYSPPANDTDHNAGDLNWHGAIKATQTSGNVNYSSNTNNTHKGWNGFEFNANQSNAYYGTYQQNGSKVIGDHIAMVMWYRES